MQSFFEKLSCLRAAVVAFRANYFDHKDEDEIYSTMRFIRLLFIQYCNIHPREKMTKKIRQIDSRWKMQS
jgi:hypothetical protein